MKYSPELDGRIGNLDTNPRGISMVLKKTIEESHTK